MAERKQPDRTPGLEGRVPYFLSFLSSVQGSRAHFRDLLLAVRAKVEEYGWKQLTACYSLTGQLKQFLEIYRLPESQSLLPELTDLGRDPNYRSLLQLCESRRMELSQGMPYDPSLGGPGGPGVDYDRKHCLHVILTVKADQLARFTKAMEEVREVFFQKPWEWKLVSARLSLAPPWRVTHFWQFGDADELLDVMQRLTGEDSYFVLDDCCESQWQQLMYDLELPGAPPVAACSARPATWLGWTARCPAGAPAPA